MAREWALAGVPEDELQPPPPPKEPDTPQGKWENFWYHYKWATIGAIVGALVLGFLTWNLLSKDGSDYYVLLVTDNPVTDTQIAQLNAKLYKYTEDIDGDGKKELLIENLYVNPKEAQLHAQMVMANSQRLMAHLSAGDRPFVIFEDSTYNDRVRPVLSEGTTFYLPLEMEVSGLAENGTCWDWYGSALQQSDELKLPDHLYFGVRGGGGLSKLSKEEIENYKRLLTAFVEEQTTAK